MRLPQDKQYFLITLLALLFWGWQIEQFWLGLLLSGVLLITLLFQGKFNFRLDAFFLMADFCALIGFAIFSFLWIDDRASTAVYPTLALLPVASLPLLLIQLLDQRGKTPVSSLMFLKRKLKTSWFDFIPAYTVMTLFAAATAKPKGYLFFAGIVLFALALTLNRIARLPFKSKLSAVGLFVVGGMLAVMLQQGMQGWQQQLEASFHRWLMLQHDTSQTATAIGEVGHLKLSDEIVLRVEPKSGRHFPMLLRKSSYVRYHKGTWFGSSWQDKKAKLDLEGWHLDHDAPQKIAFGDEIFESEMTFYQSFPKSRGVLSLPAKSRTLSNLAADSVLIKQGGSVWAEGLPAFAGFTVGYDLKGMHQLLESSDEKDLVVPKAEQSAIAQVARSLDLYQLHHEKGDMAVLNALSLYFLKEFKYSTFLADETIDESALASFLLQKKSGHCELFASATVLLLREVGIPARYAVGYSMHEWDDDAKMYLVRKRHGHAWAVAEVDGVWRSVDNTPPDWTMIESSLQSPMQGLKDFFSKLFFNFKKWRYSDEEESDWLWLTLLGVLFVILAYRVLSQVKVEEQAVEHRRKLQDKVESPWLQLESLLAEQEKKRLHGETLCHWLKRIEMESLLPLVNLYYRQRFGLFELSEDERVYFESELERHRQALIHAQQYQ